jgi:hypothetical protein
MVSESAAVVVLREPGNAVDRISAFDGSNFVRTVAGVFGSHRHRDDVRRRTDSRAPRI